MAALVPSGAQPVQYKLLTILTPPPGQIPRYSHYPISLFLPTSMSLQSLRSLSPLTPIEETAIEEIMENQEIILFTKDNRASYSGSSNRVERLSVHVTKRVMENKDSTTVQYWVNGAKIFDALQETASAINGRAIITVPSQESTEFLPGTTFFEPFLIINDPPAKPPYKIPDLQLQDGANGALSLFFNIEPINQQAAVDVPLTSVSTSRQLLESGLEASGLTPLEFARKTVKGREEKRSEEYSEYLKWLEQEIAKRDGYTDFIKNKRHTIQNQDVQQYWYFGVSCLRNLAKTHCTYTNRKIRSKDVQAALKLPASWFTDAKKGLELLEKYGSGGSDELKVVVKEVDTIHDRPKGWTALLRFLKECDTKQKAKQMRKRK
ncbi:hypothetical protein FB446DRAFT_786137 [Lentinula raphanica]|nr:hypothetical protein FB446DRAFT_786137 [Lentinula raphanica]